MGAVADVDEWQPDRGHTERGARWGPYERYRSNNHRGRDAVRPRQRSRHHPPPRNRMHAARTHVPGAAAIACPLLHRTPRVCGRPPRGRDPSGAPAASDDEAAAMALLVGPRWLTGDAVGRGSCHDDDIETRRPTCPRISSISHWTFICKESHVHEGYIAGLADLMQASSLKFRCGCR
jgi:hypothetical protein